MRAAWPPSEYTHADLLQRRRERWAFELWYIGRIVEIVARYGRDQLLAIAVPIDEIQRPIIELRNRTLSYSIAFAVFVLPLYVTLIVAWID
jgi:hypothetical protein